MEKILKNKVVVVTGGATGIGLGIVDNFLKHGAKIVIIADINEEVAAKAIESMTKKHGNDKTVFLKCDVTVDLDVTFEIVIRKYKSVDILVNNAGISNEKSVKATINVNLISVMEWSFKFYDHMRQDRGGHGGTIINVASIFGFEITPFPMIYHASKFGVVGFTKSLGHEYNFKKTGVRVVVLCPGYTHTQMGDITVLRDDSMSEEFLKLSKTFEWQEVDAVGKGAIGVFEKAESGTVWVVRGGRSAVILKE